jgi:glycosyltransferase involved in cell wall biosynthesis
MPLHTQPPETTRSGRGRGVEHGRTGVASNMPHTSTHTELGVSGEAAADVVRDLNVIIFQPTLPHYRQPFFRLLAQRCRTLTVVHGGHAGRQGFDPGRSDGSFAERIVTHRRFGPVLWMPAMCRDLNPARQDIAIFGWNIRYVHLLPALRKARYLRIGTVAWGHGYSKTDSAWRRALRNRVASAADAVMTYGFASADRLVADGFDPRRVFVAPNALDQDRIQLTRRRWLEQPDELRAHQRRHGLENRPVALYVSRLVRVDDLDVLLNAWREIRRRVPDARLAIVGDGPARRPLEAISRRYGLQDAVKFLGAIYSEDELAPWFLTARILACPRRMGLTLHHAFGYGLPVVTFDDPGKHGPEFEALKSGVNGVAVPYNDIDSLVESLHGLLTDPERARQLGAAARDTVLGAYTLPSMADGFVRAIAHAHRRGGGPAARSPRLGTQGTALASCCR